MAADKVEGLDELMRKLKRLGDWPKEQHKEIRRVNKKIGSRAAKTIKAQFTGRGRDFAVYKNGDIQKIIPSGTLRRSIKAFNAKGSRTNVLLGVKRGGSVRFDGYFAGWVESGNVGGKGRSMGSKRQGKIIPAIKGVRRLIQTGQVAEYRILYERWVKKMK